MTKTKRRRDYKHQLDQANDRLAVLSERLEAQCKMNIELRNELARERQEHRAYREQSAGLLQLVKEQMANATTIKMEACALVKKPWWRRLFKLVGGKR